VTARDRENDLASVRVDLAGAAPLRPAEPGSAADIRPGQLVFAVGNPWGERGTVTSGIVIGRGALESGSPIAGAVVADLRLAPGNSGGPMTDASGRVVGINSMIIGGRAVAVPVESVTTFLAECVAPPGALGITLRPVPLPAAAIAAGSPDDGGLLVTGVEDGSPAAAAGLLPGDLVIHLEGGGRGVAGMAGRLRRMRAGELIEMDLLRGGKPTRLAAKPAARAS
jgi:serine protease Do